MQKENINPDFLNLETDYLYHLGLDTNMDLARIFFGVKYVVFARSNGDIAVLANQFAKAWYQIEELSFTFQPIFKTERYHLYKIGPIIAISHGIGMPSTLICLNEIAKLMVHLNRFDVVFFKISPAGGIGVKEGDVVITSVAVNTKFEPIYSTVECGIEYDYRTVLDSELIEDVMVFNQNNSNIQLICGKTIGTFDYYEEQAHIDGALELEYSIKERDEYLKLAQSLDIKSIDMESLAFAGFCNQLGIRACCLSNILVDRLISDEILLDYKSQLQSKANVVKLLVEYIMHKLKKGFINEN